MTSMEIARRYDLAPKDVVTFIQANATFRVKRNFQTGEITVPDDVDLDAFFAPLLGEKLEKVQAQRRQEQEELERKRRQEQEELERKRRQEQQAVEEKLRQEDRERQEAEQQNVIAVNALKQTGAEGYYQYKAISVQDMSSLFGNTGRVNTVAITNVLNRLGMEGWRLVTAYSNELGKNSLSGTVSGFTMGTNATVDENILIFEKFIRF